MGNAARRNRLQTRHAESAKSAPALVEDTLDAPPPKAEDIDTGSLNRAIRADADSASDDELEAASDIMDRAVDQFDVAEQEGISVLEVSPTTENIGIAPEHSGTVPPTEPDPSDAVVPAAASTKKVKPLPSMEESLAAAKKENPERYAHVVEVIEQTQKGEPKRIMIRCSDPQTKQGPDGSQISVCETYRIIAVQDLFQVRCCVACADRKVRKARRNKTKERNKQLRQLVAASKASR